MQRNVIIIKAVGIVDAKADAVKYRLLVLSILPFNAIGVFLRLFLVVWKYAASSEILKIHIDDATILSPTDSTTAKPNILGQD